MLSSTSFLLALLVNKLQVNSAAQHFSDFIPVFLNTAQMWLTHQPDYLQKNSRRPPDSFKCLKNPIKVKESTPSIPRSEQWYRGLYRRGVGREKAAPSYSASLCHPNSISYHRETLNLLLSLMAKVNIVLGTHQNLLSWPHVPHFALCLQITLSTGCWPPFCFCRQLSSFSRQPIAQADPVLLTSLDNWACTSASCDKAHKYFQRFL